MNMVGVFFGALVTEWLGKGTDAGHLGTDFSLLTVVVLVAVVMLVLLLRPKTQEFQEV
jgi:hypothetical protein